MPDMYSVLLVGSAACGILMWVGLNIAFLIDDIRSENDRRQQSQQDRSTLKQNDQDDAW